MSDWEQLSTESDQHYSWFLTYRNLGPTRSLDRAYQVFKSDKEVRAPGPWAKASACHNWVARAQLWDIHVLSQGAARVVTLFIEAMSSAAASAARVLATTEPINYSEALAALRILGEMIPGDTVEATQRKAAAGETPAIGGQGSDTTIIEVGE